MGICQVVVTLIFSSSGVARQHRISPADYNILFPPFISNIRYNKHNKYDRFVNK